MNGKLVYHKNIKAVILVDQWNVDDSNCFSGTVIQGTNCGLYGDHWFKSLCTEYDSEVTISNPKPEKINWHSNGWVEDDNRVYWFYNSQTSRIICTGDNTETGGFPCYSFINGVEILQDNEYIDKEKVL